FHAVFHFWTNESSRAAARVRCQRPNASPTQTAARTTMDGGSGTRVLIARRLSAFAKKRSVILCSVRPPGKGSIVDAGGSVMKTGFLAGVLAVVLLAAPALAQQPVAAGRI